MTELRRRMKEDLQLAGYTCARNSKNSTAG